MSAVCQKENKKAGFKKNSRNISIKIKLNSETHFWFQEKFKKHFNQNKIEFRNTLQ
jgi:hypothetical protein